VYCVFPGRSETGARPTTAEEINAVLEEAAGPERWKGVLATTRGQTRQLGHHR